jgi:methylthioribose-1-phosphate isomerase
MPPDRRVLGARLRTIDWQPPSTIVIIDQARLPGELALVELRTVGELIEAIRRLRVRGAPALGVAGGLGVALAVAEAEREGWDDDRLARAISDLRHARPTAVNLVWGVDQVAGHLDEGRDTVEEAAISLVQRDVDTCVALAERGADLLSELLPGRPRGLSLHTHCNAGALACVEWGTALGVVRSLHRRGMVGNVFVGETRPLLQGARLTAWELHHEGIPYEVVVDGAGPGIIAAGMVDAVVVGADRIAANGDVANKVGTYPLALAAARHGIPFVVAAPESTLDDGTPTGDAIDIEQRPPDEVVMWSGARTTPVGAGARNPAFDVTPADLVTAIVTELRVVRPG